MEENKRANLIYQNDVKRICRRIRFGLKKVFTSWIVFVLFVLLILITIFILCWIKSDYLINEYDFLKPLNSLFLISLFTIFVLGYFYFVGNPIGSRRIRNACHQIGLTNGLNESPELIDKIQKETKKLIFENVGIPPNVWDEKKIDIESVLGISIIRIRYLDGNKKIIIEYTNADSIPQLVYWDRSKLQALPKLNLGVCNYGSFTINLEKKPHILIGGSTGSGKTILLKSIVKQFSLNNALIFIADYKGGIDFPNKWCTENSATLSVDYDETIQHLEKIKNEISHRKSLFLKLDVPNISRYNELTNDKLPRLLFACDELSQLFDKTGLSKVDKEKIEIISGLISMIARLGRAYGCHLLLATQRPDANVLNGQIKNNLDVRIAGRCDNVLSQMILDSTEASKRIIGFNSGRFLTKEGVEFQGYYDNE